jgi:hypothetical protein
MQDEERLGDALIDKLSETLGDSYWRNSRGFPQAARLNSQIV